MTALDEERRWELYAHGADVGIRGTGSNPERAFEAIALALTAAICDPGQVRSSETVQVQCAAQDLEALLFEWINAIVYEMAARRRLFGRYEVQLTGNTLTATLWGEPLDPVRHEPAVEVKGCTYTDLRVQRLPSGDWCAQCVIDV